MLKKRTIKFKIAIAFLGVFLSLVLFFPGRTVYANSVDITTLAGKALRTTASVAAGTFLLPFIDFLRLVFAGLLNLAVSFFSFIISPDLAKEVFFGDQSKKAIITGWTLVRDFLNMFYLLILVFLAIATILRVNRFSDKKLFIFVLFSAFLINFSLPITLVVIDASNLAMSFFFNGFCDAMSTQPQANVSDLTKLQKSCPERMSTYFLDRSKIIQGFVLKEGSIAPYLGAFLEALVLMLMAIAFLFLAISLLVRYLAFWVLLILSPFAFFSFAWPSNSGIGAAWGDWSKKLFHYAAYGPVLLFFLFLVAVLTRGLDEGIFNNKSNPYAATKAGEIVTFAGILYLFFYGYNLSRSIASGAGDAVTKVLNQGHSWASSSLQKMSGYNMAVNYGGAALTGLKQRAADKIPFGSFLFGSKEDDQRNKERVRLAVRGNKDEKEKYQTEQVNKMTREDREKGGKKQEDYEKDLEKGGVKAQAAAIRLAEEGMVNAMNLNDVLRATKGNIRLQRMVAQQVRDNLKKSAKDGKLNDAAKFQEAMAVLSAGWDGSIDNSGAAADIRREVMRENADVVLDSYTTSARAALNSGDDKKMKSELMTNMIFQDQLREWGQSIDTDQDKAAAITRLRAHYSRPSRHSGEDILTEESYQRFVKKKGVTELVKQKNKAFFEKKSVKEKIHDEKRRDPDNVERIITANANEEAKTVLDTI
ncbi:MAG TPA: hypothetical protein GX706_04270 [Candidatus Moranbacteria bacterium]|nr:hypothetical protein [Candidatus Moranbacteria bacterium]